MNEKKIKVMQVVPSMGYGGISSMIMNLYRNIDKTKIHMDFVAFKYGHNEIEVLANGGKVFYFDLIKEQGPLAYISKLKKVIQQNGPYEAIHMHRSYKDCFTSIAARSMKIKNRIIHSHTSDFEVKWHKLIFPFLKLLMIQNSTQFLACSKLAGEFAFKGKKYEIFTNAIDTNEYINLSLFDKNDIRHEFMCNVDELLIGHVGRFSPVKNHEFILNVALQLKKKGINFRLVLVGDGILFDNIKNKVKEIGLENEIFFTGSRNDIPRLMSAFNVLIFPSHFEGLPLTILEAQAAGIPCLVSDGVDKAVDIGVNAIEFLALSQGSELWAKKLIEVAHKKFDINYNIMALKICGYDIELNTEKIVKYYRY